MGWLGWTEQQTLDTSMQAILTAFKGRRAMLRAIFGGEDETPAPIAEEPAPRKTMSLGKQIALLAQKHKEGG